MDDDRLFRRPLRKDPLLLLWFCGITGVFIVVADEYIDWGAKYNPDRAGELFWILFWTALLLWLLALVPAVIRRSIRGDGKSSRSRAARPVASAGTGTTGTARAGWDQDFVQPATARWTTNQSGPGTVDEPPIGLTHDDSYTRTRPPQPSPLAEPTGDLQLLTVAQRQVRQGEPLRIDWYVPQADAVLIDGVKCEVTGAYELQVEKSRDVLFQAFRGDLLIRSVRVPVTVQEELPEFDWLGPPAAALHRVTQGRTMSQGARFAPNMNGASVDA